jgi:para-nitrobenzyl esterase
MTGTRVGSRGVRRAIGRTVLGLAGPYLVLAALALAGCGGQAGSGASGSSPTASASPIAPTKLTAPVRVDGGRIVGVDEGPVHAFKGIPYAAPPVGNLRWRPPQEVRLWVGIKRCVAYGASCPQDVAVEDNESVVDVQSEDCLFLNVWTPAQRAGERLPVMVWIHGGGFISGSGAFAGPYGERLSGREQVVVVSLNYRLGIFGFFAHPALSAESANGVSGNYGLLDQNAALRWVRHNIAAFGGDPRRVTIFGQSAGGQSVIAHLVSPLDRGLFARAISESPRYQDEGVGIWSTLTLSQQEAEGRSICRHLGIAEGPGTLAALRAVPADRLATATAPATGPLPLLFVQPPRPSFQPVVDGHVLPDEPWRMLRRGDWARVPVLIGSNQDECNLWLGGIKPRAAGGVTAASRRRVAWYVGPDWTALAAQFPAASYGGLLPATSRMMTVLEFNAPARYTAGVVASQHVPAYLYYFSRVPPGLPGGAHHSAEVPYVFDSLRPAHSSVHPARADVRLAGQMADYWAAFAATGDPNGPGRPHWPRYARAADVLLRLDSPVAKARAPYATACTIAERANLRR